MKTKTIHKPLLSGGLFDKPFMDSRATTQTVSTKEWVLGHLIGPLGLIFVVNTIAALVEKRHVWRGQYCHDYEDRRRI